MTHRILGLLGLVGCSGAMPPPGTLGSSDADGDGWTVSDGDCDDQDPAVFPLAIDVPGDGIDQDCDGEDAVALAARGLDPGDVFIDEVMPDPLAVGGNFGEWFEVRNRLTVPVDLQGVTVHDLDKDDFVIAGSLVVEAGGVVVLAVAEDSILNGGVRADYDYSANFGLSNDEDALVLQFATTVLDVVTWAPGFPLESGRSMSLDPSGDATTNDFADAWCLGDMLYGVAGRGSPGALNPACPAVFGGLRAVDLQAGDLVLTEILQDPSTADSGAGEWLEILNTTEFDVDLQGVVLSDDEGAEYEIGGVVVAAGQRVVLAGSDDPDLNGGLLAAEAWGTHFGLRNGDQAVVLSFGTREIDRVVYDNGDTFPDPRHASMSLDPGSQTAAANDLGSNWCEGSQPYGDGDLGTPGAPNTPCG